MQKKRHNELSLHLLRKIKFQIPMLRFDWNLEFKNWNFYEILSFILDLNFATVLIYLSIIQGFPYGSQCFCVLLKQLSFLF